MKGGISINHYKKAIPTPKLMIIDHKKCQEKKIFNYTGDPRKKLAATFTKVVYLELKKIYKKNEFKYTRFTIVQA